MHYISSSVIFNNGVICTSLYVQIQFIGDPQHEALVRAEWQEKTRVKLKDKVYKAGKASPSKIITWMTDDLQTGLKDKLVGA